MSLKIDNQDIVREFKCQDFVRIATSQTLIGEPIDCYIAYGGFDRFVMINVYGYMYEKWTVNLINHKVDKE